MEMLSNINFTEIYIRKAQILFDNISALIEQDVKTDIWKMTFISGESELILPTLTSIQVNQILALDNVEAVIEKFC